MNDLERFDAPFFGLSSNYANRFDPQLRILHEVVFEAIVDAGKVRTKTKSNGGFAVMVKVIWKLNSLEQYSTRLGIPTGKL